MAKDSKKKDKKKKKDKVSAEKTAVPPKTENVSVQNANAGSKTASTPAHASVQQTSTQQKSVPAQQANAPAKKVLVPVKKTAAPASTAKRASSWSRMSGFQRLIFVDILTFIVMAVVTHAAYYVKFHFYGTVIQMPDFVEGLIVRSLVTDSWALYLMPVIGIVFTWILGRFCYTAEGKAAKIMTNALLFCIAAIFLYWVIYTVSMGSEFQPIDLFSFMPNAVCVAVVQVFIALVFYTKRKAT